MTTGANGQKTCILRTDEKHDAIWHHGAGKGSGRAGLDDLEEMYEF